MLVNQIILILTLKIIEIKSIPQSLCVISSDYVPNLLRNLIYEYKFTELQSTKTVLSEMKKFSDELKELWTEALFNSATYDSYMYKFYYITQEYSKKADQAVKTIDLISVKDDDVRVKTVVDFLNKNDFKNALSAYNTLGNQGLLFTIVDKVYTTDERTNIDVTWTKSITKLIEFSNVLLESKRVRAAVTLALALFKAMIVSNNIFTNDMMYFAEFVVVTSQIVNTQYFHEANYEELRQAFIYIEKSLPQVIQNFVFGSNNYNQSDGLFYIKNEHWKEHIFVGDFFHGDAYDRRIAYSWEYGIELNQKKWKIKYDMKRIGYTIMSHDYGEYLYATDKSHLYNVTIRPVFTRKDSIEKAIWLIEPMEDNKFFLIRNKFYNEYMYVPEDETFAGVYAKRRVFTYFFEVGYFVPYHAPGIWTLERV